MLLFSVVSLTPTIVVAVFSTVFFDLGIQAWFSEPVRVVLRESLNASRGYLEEHRNNIRIDALGMANDLARAGGMLTHDPNGFAEVLAEQTALRGLTDAVIFEPVTGQILASAGAIAGTASEPPPTWATALAASGEVAVLGSDNSSRVSAVVQLDATPALLLQISRPVDAKILDHMKRTEDAVESYERMDQNRSGLQITIAFIFALVA